MHAIFYFIYFFYLFNPRFIIVQPIKFLFYVLNSYGLISRLISFFIRLIFYLSG